MSTEAERIAQLESQLAVTRSEVSVLKDQSAQYGAMSNRLVDIEKRQIEQDGTLKHLAGTIERLAESTHKANERLTETTTKTNEVVQGVLKTWDNEMLERAKAWSLGNVVRIGAVCFGSVGGISILGTLIYAAIKFISKQP